MGSNNRQVETLLSWKLSRLPPSMYSKKEEKGKVCLASGMPAHRLGCPLPFPQHLLKPEKVPVKSRSFSSEAPCCFLPVFLSGPCPTLSTQGRV